VTRIVRELKEHFAISSNESHKGTRYTKADYFLFYFYFGGNKHEFDLKPRL